MLQNLLEQARLFGRGALNGRARWSGRFGYSINGGEYAWDRNRVVDEGINYILNAALRGESVLSNFYIAPFAANVTPAANLSASNFATTMNEFVAYNETTRRQWTTDGASSALFLVNDSAPALFTINATGTIWGAGLLSASGKSATSGVLVAAAKRSAGLAVESGFEIRIKYKIEGASS
jgi:hypothetical protein